jgi:hypothetical protein
VGEARVRDLLGKSFKSGLTIDEMFDALGEVTEVAFRKGESEHDGVTIRGAGPKGARFKVIDYDGAFSLEIAFPRTPDGAPTLTDAEKASILRLVDERILPALCAVDVADEV